MTYSLTQADDSAIPTWMTFTASTRTISGIPTSSDVGSVTLKYTATDGTGESGSESLVLNVQRKPAVANAIPNQSLRTSETLTYTIPSNTFSDDDGDTMTITMSNVPSWATFTSSTQIITGTASSTDAGQFVTTVKATDTTGASVTTTLTIRAIHNLSPILVNEIPDQSIPLSAYSYTFGAATFSDANGDTLTYTISGNPSWLSIDSATRTLSGTPDINFEYNITVTASDAYGGSGSDTFLLFVGTGIPNNSPVVANPIASQFIVTTKEFTINIGNGVFTDADGDALTYTATLNDGSSIPSWMVLSGNNLEGEASTNDIGTYVIKITATDGKGGTASTTFLVTVEPYSSTSDGIAMMVIIVVIILLLLLIIVVVILILRKKRIDKHREVMSDSSSDDEVDEIIDKTGALTQFLANTHTLEGSKFIPNPSVGSIYQKKALDALFTPQDTVKKFFKNKYGFEYDDDKGVFVTNTATFEGTSAMRKTHMTRFDNEDIKEEDFEDDEEEKELPISNRAVSPKIVVKSNGRKGNSPKSGKKKGLRSSMNKSTIGKKSQKLKGKSKSPRSKSPNIKTKAMKNSNNSKVKSKSELMRQL